MKLLIFYCRLKFLNTVENTKIFTVYTDSAEKVLDKAQTRTGLYLLQLHL